MGRQVTVTLICDVCKKPADEKIAIAGQLAAARRRFSLHLHKACLDSLTSSAEPVARRRRRGRPRGSTTKKKAS